MNSDGEVCFREGRLYFTADAFERLLSGAAGVILLREERNLLLLPVRQASAGGFIPKVRNASGDRVVNGANFFRDQGVGDAEIWQGDMAWNEERAALILYEFFAV
jgi:hypothetical protein